MSCSCSISSGDSCNASVSSEKHPKARIEHTCSECYRKIQKGEIYESYRAIYDGSWYTTKTCIDCESVRNALLCNWECETVWESIFEHYSGSNNLPSAECMMTMTKAGRDRLCDIIEDGWGKLV